MSYAFAYKRDFMIYGEPIVWLRSMGQCPCYNVLTNEFNTSHPLCGGTGFLREYVDVSMYQALVHSLTARSKYDRKYGEVKEGDCALSTWPDEINWDENDIFIIPSRTTTRTEIIVRGSGAYDALSQPYVTSIERIFGTSGVLPATDYKLTNAAVATLGQVTWSGGITADEQYSIRYTYSPRFTVVQGSILHRKPDLMGGLFPQSGQLRLMTLTPTDGQ